jgi:hypothetical protein
MKIGSPVSESSFNTEAILSRTSVVGRIVIAMVYHLLCTRDYT